MTHRTDYEMIYQTLAEGFSLSDDMECREIQRNDADARLLYIQSICDSKSVVQNLLIPFWQLDTFPDFEQYLQSLPGCVQHRDVPSTIQMILRGYVGVFLTGGIYLFAAMSPQESSIRVASVETVIQGPQDAFNESLTTKLNMIRMRYQSESLRIEMDTIGKLSKTKIAIVYDNLLVDQKALQELKQSLDHVELDMLQAVGQLENQMQGWKRWSLFPTIVITERPDRSVFSIAKGKIIIVMDRTPFVGIVPSAFLDFFSSMDDVYQLRVVGRFLLFLRYIGLFLAVSMPALYVGTVSYNPEIYRVQLAFSIASSRAAVPYPSFLEVVFMLVMMEFLTEASIRLPRSIGPAATTVGGLILGQAATEAGLVSNIMIIIVSVVALSNFVIPINEMAFAVRTIKYFLLLVTTFFGLVGFMAGMVALVFYTSNLTSYGRPYIKLFRKD